MFLKEWELSDESLAVSYEAWRSMVGDPPTQLNLERYSGLDVSQPKHGKIDPENTPHVGGNTWAGGTGGRDTAGKLLCVVISVFFVLHLIKYWVFY